MTDAAATSSAVVPSAVELMQAPGWDLDRLRRVRAAIFDDRTQMDSLRVFLRDYPADSLMAGLGNWAMGAFEKAMPGLNAHESEPNVRAVLALNLVSLGRFRDALALVASPTTIEEAKAKATAVLRLASGGDMERLNEVLRAPGLLEGTAWMPFLRGWKAEQELRIDDAIELYQQAHEIDADLGDCTFHLARLLELRGCDEEAVDLYEDFLMRFPPNPAVLSNLGLLFEDLGEFAQAESCFRSVLKLRPDDERAQLFLADVEASKHMLYDEDLERREDKRNAILRTPVTDFELSVRSRNCLAKMGIRTLGDLVQKTEAELLSYKNFGETSLTEIQQILTSKNLRLGMDPDELTNGTFGSQRQPIGDLSDPRNRPVTELELSVRSRRVVELFKLRTIGDLCNKTEAELMACPNFGQTSLNEIKSKLDELGLALKG